MTFYLIQINYVNNTGLYLRAIIICCLIRVQNNIKHAGIHKTFHMCAIELTASWGLYYRSTYFCMVWYLIYISIYIFSKEKIWGYRNWYFINTNYLLHDYNFLLSVTNYCTFFKAHSLSTFGYYCKEIVMKLEETKLTYLVNFLRRFLISTNYALL